MKRLRKLIAVDICFIAAVTLFLIGVSNAATWNKKNLPTAASKLNAAHFLEDGIKGWIAGDDGLIFYTHNSGETWEKQDSGVNDNINAIYFVNEYSGCAVGSGGTSIFTSDGGVTWNKAKTEAMSTLTAVSFSGYRGFAVGNSGTILSTQNIGKEWTVLESPTSNDLFGVFTKFNKVWMVGSGGLILNSNSREIKWETQETGITYDLNSICFTSSYEGYAVGTFGTVLVTYNGGKTWESIKKFDDNDIRDIYAVGTSDLWVVGDRGLLWHSHDRGKTWNQENLDDKMTGFHGGYFSKWGGWTVGDRGTTFCCRPISASLDLKWNFFAIGVSDGGFFLPKVNVNGNVGSWSLTIENKRATTVKSFSGYKNIPKEIKWDGKNDNGEIVDLGEYTAYLTVTDEKTGFSTTISSKPITVKKFTPKVTVIITPHIFSPSAGEKARITIEVNLDKSNIKTKVFYILDENGNTIKTFISPQGSFTWDGKNDMGEETIPGIYMFTATIISKTGSIALESKGFIVIDSVPQKEKVLVITLANIFFDNGSATLKPADEEELFKSVEIIKKYPSCIVQIKGYCDKGEIADDLLKLSIDRVNAVSNYFVNKGKIDKQRTVTLAYGAAKSEKRDIKNKKVEVLLVYQNTK